MRRCLNMWFLVLLILVMVSCSPKIPPNNDKNKSSKENKKSQKTNIKAKKVLTQTEKPITGISKGLTPSFKPIEIVYNPKKKLSQDDLSPLTEIELDLLRVQLYAHNKYNFEEKWKKAFYKEKFGYILRPVYESLDMPALDKLNDSLIIEELKLRIKIKKNQYALPIHVGHIRREVNGYPSRQRYYTDIHDALPILFKQDQGIPVGFLRPILGQRLKDKSWKDLMTERKTIKDLVLPKKQTELYLVKYHPNNYLKYIITYKVIGDKLTPRNATNFSLYDLKGILRRSIYIVGNQDIYELDYIYDKKGQVTKIIEKVVQNNALLRASSYKKSYNASEPGSATTDQSFLPPIHKNTEAFPRPRRTYIDNGDYDPVEGY